MPLTTVGRWTVLYAVVAAEFAAITGSYFVWRDLNRSQDYRRWMYDHHPRVLDVFYMSCNLAGVTDAKERDLRDWNISR